jgi:hypothetical protein
MLVIIILIETININTESCLPALQGNAKMMKERVSIVKKSG